MVAGELHESIITALAEVYGPDFAKTFEEAEEILLANPVRDEDKIFLAVRRRRPCGYWGRLAGRLTVCPQICAPADCRRGWPEPFLARPRRQSERTQIRAKFRLPDPSPPRHPGAYVTLLAERLL